ncbi:hypothetical protein HCTV5_34 [Halovirus HCTV-5]|uniref:hypothetical protein n=1 Tax=Halovirus HCTV-5 TaxID=1273748 RepID=UPI000334873F|nr:hypothetical protein M200_gp034 [Halovirus HCTV-5]AGM11644.1 hypothetical protein HCTV5_34 [Halovirus HCTV-5]
MSEYTRLAYAPAATHPYDIHVWEVLDDGDTEHFGAFDEVCHDGYCVTSDDLSEERRVSVRDTTVERKGDTTTLTLIDVAEEPDE